MDTCLSLTSCKAGSGLQGPTHIALSSISNRCETALINTHSEVTPPQMSKRELKSLEKEEQKYNSRSPKFADKQSSCENLKEQTATTSLSQDDKSMRANKRRKVSEDSEISYTSKDSGPYISSDSSQFQDLKLSNFSSLSESKSEENRNQNYDSENVEDARIHQPEISKNASNTSIGSNDTSVTSETDTTLQHFVLSKAQNLCGVFNGKLLTNEILRGRGGNDSLGFECCNKHQFIISLSALTKLKAFSTQDKDCCDVWCLKCRNFIKKTKERADSMRSKIISSGLDKQSMIVQCENSHTFEISYTRNYNKIWCEECLIDAKAKQSQYFKEQEQVEEERKQKEQKRIFEESYKEMIKEQQIKNSKFSSMKEVEYYEYIMKEVCICAKRKMEAEMSSLNFKGICTHIEIYNVYKILYMPIEVLIKSLCMIKKSQLSTHYRQLALILHPDKNKHEFSNESFLKLVRAYEICKQITNSA